MNEHSENAQFAQLIVALEPWLTQVVIIGGWAHRLYRLHPSAQHIEYLPLTTLDTDIAVPARLKVHRHGCPGTTNCSWIRRRTIGPGPAPCNALSFREREDRLLR